MCPWKSTTAVADLNVVGPTIIVVRRFKPPYRQTIRVFQIKWIASSSGSHRNSEVLVSSDGIVRYMHLFGIIVWITQHFG